VAWILLVAAGLLEVAWASVLPSTEGLTKPVPTVLFLVLLTASMVGLAKATETIPIGTGYVVWVGIGAVGAAVVGMVRGDAVTVPRVLFLTLIVIGVLGLRAASSH
jgi:quaternary ammonium compound-resistance protein SugE